MLRGDSTLHGHVADNGNSHTYRSIGGAVVKFALFEVHTIA